MKCLNKPPTLVDVTKTWGEYILQEESRIAKELTTLNETQKKLLILIADGQIYSVVPRSALHKMNISRQAATKALTILCQKDYLYKDTSGKYLIIDPLLKASLQFFYL
jgi:hypothetical protein